MTTTTEKIIDLLETENDNDLITDVETLEKMGYSTDTIQAMLIMIITLRSQNRLLERELDIAESNIERLNNANTILVNKIQKIHLESILE